MSPTERERALRDYLDRREQRGAQLTSAGRVLARASAAGGRSEPLWGGRHVLATTLATVATLAVVGGTLTAGLLHRGATQQDQGHHKLVVPSTPPPPGIPLLWYGDPDDPGRLVAVDWTGRPVGSLPIPRYSPPSMFPTAVQPSADGQRLIVSVWNDDMEHLITAQGEKLADLPLELHTDHVRNNFRTVFADDGGTLCQARSASRFATAGSTASLVSIDSHGSERRVTDLGASGGKDSLAWEVASCSVARDRAVVVEYAEPPATAEGGPTTTTSSSQNGKGSIDISTSITMHATAPAAVLLRVVRLSDGATVVERRPSSGVRIVFSPDSTLYAEVDGDTGSVIRSLADGAVVGRVDGVTVNAFSSDDRTVVGPSLSHPVQGGRDAYLMVDWHGGTRVFSAGFSLPQVMPGTGGDFLVIERIPNQGSNLIVVHPDGTTVRIAHDVEWNSGLRCPSPCLMPTP